MIGVAPVSTLTTKKLLEELKDKETREHFVAEHVTTGLPFQIHGLREKLGLTQAELAKRADMAQERISVLEDPNYEFIPKINTLLKLANVFDVPLIVRFGSWKEVFDWETNLSPEALAPPSFDEELASLEESVSAGITITTPAVGTVSQFNFSFAQVRAGNVFHPDFTVSVRQISWADLEKDNPIDWEQLTPAGLIKDSTVITNYQHSN